MKICYKQKKKDYLQHIVKTDHELIPTNTDVNF